MSVLFIFIDGIGVGDKSKENPLATPDWSSFSYFTGAGGLHKDSDEVNEPGILYKAIDANLDVEGLPQSGTGQTSLFSGVNASKIAGKHYGPYPYTTTRYLLEEQSLFHKVMDNGMNPVFMNAYPKIFFECAEKRDRWTATTMMARSAGIRLNRVEDLLAGKAITAEIIQNVWREKLKLDVPDITKEQAGERIIQAAKIHNLVLYEFYLTDKAGHSMDRTYADQIRDLLDPFLMHIIENMDENDTLVITSDHGNMEDLSTKTHTRNPVPLFVKGDTDAFQSAKSILDVTPGILSVLKKESKE